MSIPSDELLTVSQQLTCCCSSLISSPSHLSSWHEDTIPIPKVKPLKCDSKSCRHKMLYAEPVDSITPSNKVTRSSSKHSFTLVTSDSKSQFVNSKLLLNYKIPYQFSHQTSATVAIKDYCNSHTYPILQRRVQSANSERNYYCRTKSSSGYNGYARSSSETQIATTLTPKTIVLGEYQYSGIKQQQGSKKQAKERSSSSLGSSPKLTIRKSPSRIESAKTKPKAAALGSNLSLKMKWASEQQVPSFVVKPNKSRDSSYNDILRRYSTAPQSDQQLIKATVLNGDRKLSKSVCNVAPPSENGSKTDTSYRYYCQQERRGASADNRISKVSTNGHLIKSPGSITINNPWGDNNG